MASKNVSDYPSETTEASPDWFASPTGQVQQIAAQLKRLTFDEAVYIGHGLSQLANEKHETPVDLAAIVQSWASRIVKAAADQPAPPARTTEPRPFFADALSKKEYETLYPPS
jgi:hypothetical protein